jgi:pyruvate/2-oxoglutarate dehydrogenase complex dihydrolipoamide dehydrogenase (E3) component
VRLVASGDRLVGAHIQSPSAGETIREPALAISAKVRGQSLSSLVHVYPIYPSSVGEAAALGALERARRLRSRLSWRPL